MDANQPAHVPILLNHDPARAIGVVEVIGEQLFVRFATGTKITKDLALEILGNAALMLTDVELSDDGTQTFIRRARIAEWSLAPTPAQAR